ncbi:hypothetical protein HXX76_012457 [Chlamydomonas incerta]|uniref:U-box domain-containing protein n=1 Tax=Chlamydomonas incerta TaxID=51695 RepID=A0A835SKK3_CHLIN|nr:hypothetical protein HXX76_012457 [Chlamydomonas incerta]|eukprot:KAG2427261.1 hypothetical protein HXX76_012457 [Chlamydomonas incerta]
MDPFTALLCVTDLVGAIGDALDNYQILGDDAQTLKQLMAGVESVMTRASDPELLDDSKLREPQANQALQEVIDCLQTCSKLINKLGGMSKVVKFVLAGQYLDRLRLQAARLANALQVFQAAAGLEQHADLRRQFRRLREELVNVKLEVLQGQQRQAAAMRAELERAVHAAGGGSGSGRPLAAQQQQQQQQQQVAQQQVARLEGIIRGSLRAAGVLEPTGGSSGADERQAVREAGAALRLEVEELRAAKEEREAHYLEQLAAALAQAEPGAGGGTGSASSSGRSSSGGGSSGSGSGGAGLGGPRDPLLLTSELVAPVLSKCLCPISYGVMHDPVLLGRTGHTYERAVIAEHLATSNTDPLTNSPLESAELTPNWALRDVIEALLHQAGLTREQADALLLNSGGSGGGARRADSCSRAASCSGRIDAAVTVQLQLGGAAGGGKKGDAGGMAGAGADGAAPPVCGAELELGSESDDLDWHDSQNDSSNPHCNPQQQQQRPVMAPATAMVAHSNLASFPLQFPARVRNQQAMSKATATTAAPPLPPPPPQPQPETRKAAAEAPAPSVALPPQAAPSHTATQEAPVSCAPSAAKAAAVTAPCPAAPSPASANADAASSKGAAAAVAGLARALTPGCLGRPSDEGGGAGQTPLHGAAREGNADRVRELLLLGARLDAADADGFTALHLASYQGHRKVAKALLKAGASVNAAAKSGFTPLHCASYHGHEEVVTMLLDANANANAIANDRATPLHVATRKGHRMVVEALLKKRWGAHVNATDEAGRTALHLAVQLGDVRLVKGLIASAASVDMTDSDNRTPLHYAAAGVGDSMVQVVKVLLASSASTKAKDKVGNLPLHLAEANGAHPVVKQLLR